MATATFELALPAGYTQESGKLVPSGLSYDGTDYSGNDGTYDVYEVSSTGEWTYEEVVLSSVVAPAGAPVIGTPVLTDTTAEIPVTYAEGDADSLEYSLDSGTWTTFTSPIQLSGLTAEQQYSLAVRARNTAGTSTEASTTLTTEAAPVVEPESATATFTLGVPAGYSMVTIPQNPDTYMTQDWDEQPEPDGKFVYDNEDGTTELNSEPNLVKTDSDVLELYYVSPTGVWTYAPITWANLPVTDEPTLDAPVLASAIPDQSATEGEAFSLDLATYLTGSEITYSVTGLPAVTGLSLSGSILSGTPVAADLAGSPLSLTATATNATDSASDTFSVTVEAAAQVPQGTITIGTITKDDTSASIPFTYSGSDATSYEHSTNGTDWTDVTSPVTRSGLDPETAYSGQIRPVNAEGSGTAVTYNLTTDAAAPQVPQGLITFGTASIAATSWSQPYSYDGDDATGFEHRINGGNWVDSTSPVSMPTADPETEYTLDVRPYNDVDTGSVASVTITTLEDTSDPQPEPTVVERVYTISAYNDKMPATQRFSMYQGDRVRLMVDHPFDLTGKSLLFRIAPKKGAPARFTLTSENDQFVITSAMAEELAVSNKVWQLILKDNDSRVVVGDGACDIKQRIKE